MKKQLTKTALVLALACATGTVAFAHHDEYHHNHHYYHHNRVVESTHVDQGSGYRSVYVAKVIDKTQAGLSQSLMDQLGRIADDPSYKNPNARKRAMDYVIERDYGKRYELLVSRQYHGPKTIDVFMVYDANQVEKEGERFFRVDPRYDRDQRPIYNDRKKVKVGGLLGKFNEALGRLGVPWIINDRPDYQPVAQDYFNRYSSYRVDEYKVDDHTRTLTAEDVRYMANLGQPYTGQSVQGKDIYRVEEEMQTYLDNAYGPQYYEVRAHDLDGRKVKIDVNRGHETYYYQHVRLGMIDETNALTRQDLARIGRILDDYRSRDGKVKQLAKDANRAVQRYLDIEYGKDVYRVDLKKRSDRFYQVRIRR